MTLETTTDDRRPGVLITAYVDGVLRSVLLPASIMVDSAGLAISSTNPLPSSPAKATTSTTTPVAAAAADTAILTANTSRLPGSTIANDSTAIMYVLLGSGVASTTNYTAAIDGKTTVPGVLTLPDGYVGAVRAYWVSATGSARVTELSA